MTTESAETAAPLPAGWVALKKQWRERWAEFRGRSKYFQVRVLILATYLGVVILTAVWAPPPAMEQNDIGARILALAGDPVVGPYLIVENRSGSHWQRVSFEIDQGYIAERQLVQAGEKVTLFVKDFHKTVMRSRRGRQIPKKVAAPLSLPLTKLVVSTANGKAVAPIKLAQASSGGHK